MTDIPPVGGDAVPRRTPQSAEGRMLSAEMRSEEAEWRRLYDSAAQESEWFQVMPIAFSMAAWRRFGRDSDLRVIAAFSRVMVDRYSTHGDFSPRDVEATVRSATGEEILAAYVDPVRAGEIKYAGLFALVDDLALSDADVDEMLVAAEQVVREASASESFANVPAEAPVIDSPMHRRFRQPLTADPAMKRLPQPKAWRKLRLPKAAGRPRRPRKGGKPTSVAGALLTATMLRHSEERQRLLELLKRLHYDDLSYITKAAFEVAVPTFFGTEASPRDVRDFTNDLRQAFGDHVDLIKMEYLIRSSLGEDLHVSDIVPRDEMLAKTFTLGGIADMWDRDVQAVNAVVSEGEARLRTAGQHLVDFTDPRI